MAIRIDLGALRPPKRMPDGTLVAEGLLTRAGVFVYRNSDGTERRELRPPEEVFRKDSLETFALRPVTNGHPPELLSSKNARKYAVGTVGESVVRDEDHIRARLSVYDADTIAQMEAGKASLSCGYEVDVDETPGTHPVYGRYDCVQRNIRGNHLAIVANGRAGETARVRMDAAVMLQEHKAPPKGAAMDENKTKEALTAALEQVAAQTARADAAEKARDDASIKAEELGGKVQSLQEELATLKQVRQDADQSIAREKELKAQLEIAQKARQDAEDPERLRSAVTARVRLETAAAAVLGGHVRLDTLGDRDVMVAVLERLGHASDVKDATDAYVKGRFDVAIERYLNGGKALDALKISMAKPEPEKRLDARSARERMIAHNRGLAAGQE